MPSSVRTVRRAAARLAMRPALGVASLALLGACGHQTAIETGLNKDLALADQLQRAPALVSTQELSSAVAAPAPAVTQSAAPQVARTRVVFTRTVERTPSTHMEHPTIATVDRTTVDRTTVDRTTDGEVVASGPAAPSERTSPVSDGRYDAGTTTGGTESSVPAVAAASAPIYRQQAQAHTARDGVFGSIAGAIIGAAASHGDRVRGGLIGAATGGALGAIYGHSVDRTYASAYPTYGSSAGYRRTPRYRGTI